LRVNNNGTFPLPDVPITNNGVPIPVPPTNNTGWSFSAPPPTKAGGPVIPPAAPQPRDPAWMRPGATSCP
jgi:hypothetical protein